MELQDTPQNIYDYIEQEELEFSKGIDILGWDWSMQEHVKTSFYYKHGRLLNGNDESVPVKNIVKPILNMQYWSEDIDVKDIVLYVENPEKYHLSFLVKKYHDDVFLKENNLDSLLDELNISRIDYGGGLVMDTGTGRPKKMDLETIAFCNQSNLLSSPIGFKFYMSPSDLQEMKEKGWGDISKGATHTIDEAIILSRSQNGSNSGNIKQPTKTSGKYVEVYLVIGNLPEKYLDDSDTGKYAYQMQVVCFYTDKDNNKQGITLFARKCKNPFKLIKRDDVFGRALGYGAIEELFEAQAWTTYSEIQKKEMVDAASKVIHISDDEGFAKRNHNLKGINSNEVLLLESGKTIRQMDTYPRSMVLLEKSVNEWQEYAQQIGGAPNPLMGKEPVSGTPFALQSLVVQTGQSLHNYRKGQYAKFIEEMYHDWIIPYITREIVNGKKFLSSLSMEEMQKISDFVVNNEANKYFKEKILNGVAVYEQELEEYKNEVRQNFMKDNNKFIEILKDELAGAKINIKVNVANKQKNLASMTDAISNIMRQAFSTYDPNTKTFAIFDDPRMSKLFNQILEYSDMSMIDFNNYAKPQQQVQQPNQQAPAPQPALVA